MDKPPSYSHFTAAYPVPYSIVAFLYMITAFTITVAVIITSLCGSCCCRNKFCTWLSSLLERFNSWLIQLIFGLSGGLSEKSDEKENHIYVNGCKLKTTDVNILGVIILIFGLLVSINAYGAYLLEVTYTCSEDTAIYCYPLPLNSELTISVAIDSEPITDCANWTNSSIAPYITFQCFRYALNSKAALATAGGLLALFTFIMRTTISIIIKVFQVCHLHKWKKCVTTVQTIVAFCLVLLDLVAAYVALGYQVLSNVGEQNVKKKPAVLHLLAHVEENGIQFVAALGTIALLLLIPWADYTDPNKHNTDSEGVYNMFLD